MPNNKTYSIAFDSITAIGQYLDTHPAISNRHRDYTSKSACETTPKDALDMALQGGYWPEGAQDIKPIDLDTSTLRAHEIDIPQPEASVMGYRPNVSAYLANAPESMWRMRPSPRPDRLIKIAVHIGKQYGVTPEQTFNRGNAILSVVNALSAKGYAIELWAVWRNQDKHSYTVNIDTLIKPSTAAYNPDSIAFALCNVAFQRRIVWRCLASIDNTVIHNFGISMGNGLNADYAGFDLHYGYMRVARHWDNKESALKTILRDTEEQLHGMGVQQ